MPDEDPIIDSQETLVAYQKQKWVDPKGQGKASKTGKKPPKPAPVPKALKPLNDKAKQQAKSAGNGGSPSRG